MSIQCPGIYTVTLQVKNAVGSDTEVKLRYITVKESDAQIRIEALKQYIHWLPYPAWSKWFLTMPLDRALDQLEKGHGKPAIIQMKVFIGSVELPGQVPYYHTYTVKIYDWRSEGDYWSYTGIINNLE